MLDDCTARGPTRWLDVRPADAPQLGLQANMHGLIAIAD